MAEDVSLTVSQALSIAKEKLEALFLRVVGEVSEISDRATYKAVYFSVGDDDSVMSCIMWRSQYDAQDIKLEVGMLVELTGRFTVYPSKGRMQFSVSSIADAGLGDLKAQLAKRLEMLRAEGLLDDSRKRALPRFPAKIALITSPHGKAVHDVLKTLKRRFPLIEVDFYGIKVEGEGAGEQIASALNLASNSDAELILLVRGGGSFEDLLPFSEEVVARSIAAAKIPVVTGIGHEPDVSIADYVADRAAPTPTGAAELVSPDRAELLALINQKQQRLMQNLRASAHRARLQLTALSSREVIKNPTSFLLPRAQHIDTLEMRLRRAIPDNLKRDQLALERLKTRFMHSHERQFERNKHQLLSLVSKLEALSPLQVLSRGYAALFDETNEQVISSVHQVAVDDDIQVRLKDGALLCRVKETK